MAATALLAALLSTVATLVYGGNILISGEYGAGSHFMTGSLLGQVLAGRGHKVTMLISEAFAHRAEDPVYRDLNFVIFKHAGPIEEVRNRFNSMRHIMFDPIPTQMAKYVEIYEPGFLDDCKNILRDDDVIGQLKKQKFDVMILDTVWICTPLIAAKIGGIPLIGMSPVTGIVFPINLSAGNPLYPAIMPEMTSGATQRMTFYQRLHNAFLSGLFRAVYPSALKSYDALIAEHNLYPEGKTLFDVIRHDIMLWLVNTDFAFDFPIPITPNIIPTGGLTARPAQPLSEDLEKFMASSGDHGVVIFSLGSYFTFGDDMTSMKSDLFNIFADAFAELDQKVIWHMKEADKLNITLPPNVKALKWMPQNDLLGHNKTRVFMFHGGNNGLNELAYHGVPTVVIPLMGDQHDTGARVKARGLGVTIDKMTLATDVVLSSLREVLDNEKYAKNAKRVAAIFRDRPMPPRERAAFWVEHVIKHGGDHLSSSFKDLSFVESFMFDVFGFLILVLSIIVMFFYVSLRWLFRACKKCIGSKDKIKLS
ncbi:UDP-glucuronosyltransferase 2C1-like [Diadema setosum]|uniref:UDP-glucuronosyltransferase 2C1-like n=1 Tax=Diadema setosum TaxID=31175 RepID=UPI003B3B4DC7